jgi:hypothetical protein
MKPAEILGMIEEASGTRMFEERKEKAVKTMAKKDKKVEEIASVSGSELRSHQRRFTERRVVIATPRRGRSSAREAQRRKEDVSGLPEDYLRARTIDKTSQSLRMDPSCGEGKEGGTRRQGTSSFRGRAETRARQIWGGAERHGSRC